MRITPEVDVDILRGWSIEKENQVLGISAITMKALEERGIEPSLGVYAKLVKCLSLRILGADKLTRMTAFPFLFCER